MFTEHASPRCAVTSPESRSFHSSSRNLIQFVGSTLEEAASDIRYWRPRRTVVLSHGSDLQCHRKDRQPVHYGSATENVHYRAFLLSLTTRGSRAHLVPERPQWTKADKSKMRIGTIHISQGSRAGNDQEIPGRISMNCYFWNGV